MDDRCYRCGRAGHWAAQCFARTHADGGDLSCSSDDDGNGSYDSGCDYSPARASASSSSRGWGVVAAGVAAGAVARALWSRIQHGPSRGTKRPRQQEERKPSDVESPSKRTRPPRSAVEQVYVLQLAQGRVYVGKSQQPEQRIQDHSSGCGAAFTREYPPTGQRLLCLSPVRGDAIAQERHETLCQMQRHGIERVRGAAWTKVHLDAADKAEIVRAICEKDDLCRRCGRASHMIDQCYARRHALTGDWIDQRG